MKKKINARFIQIGILSIVVTSLVMTAAFYAQVKRQVFSDLHIMAEILIEEDSIENQVDNLRITVINKDGSVAYDSDVDASKLSSHLD
ncbi:MAG: two-component sensor histidine kinase, partial [Clostridia bacterium]|nr:two-component sensor histidine kinase [Clostridia bacterium]